MPDSGFGAALLFSAQRLRPNSPDGARPPANTAIVDAALRTLDTEDFQARLGRIACGYDGGQIYEEDEGARDRKSTRLNSSH